MLKPPNLPTLTALLALAAPIAAAPVTWSYDSRIAVERTSTANGDGSYSYTFLLTNADAADIWFLSLYTGSFEARDLVSSIAEWQAFAYTSPVFAGEDWSLPGAEDGWMAAFTGEFTEDTPYLGPFLAAGQTATVGFTLDGLLEGDAAYGYWTRGDYEWNRYTAVGPAVPEASSLALLVLGGVLLLGGAVLRKQPD